MCFFWYSKLVELLLQDVYYFYPLRQFSLNNGIFSLCLYISWHCFHFQFFCTSLTTLILFILCILFATLYLLNTHSVMSDILYHLSQFFWLSDSRISPVDIATTCSLLLLINLFLLLYTEECVDRFFSSHLSSASSSLFPLTISNLMLPISLHIVCCYTYIVLSELHQNGATQCWSRSHWSVIPAATRVTPQLPDLWECGAVTVNNI